MSGRRLPVEGAGIGSRETALNIAAP